MNYKNYITLLLAFLIASCSNERDITYEALFNSINDNKILVLETILNKNKLDINYIDQELDTSALHEAANVGNKDIINLLINKNADVNIKNNRLITPLMIASSNNYVDVMATFLSYNADIDALDNKNYNALMYAVQNGNYYATEFLFENGINIDVKSIDSKSSLDIAVENNYNSIVDLLMRKSSPLIESIIANDDEKSLTLIKIGSNLDVIDSKGTTALLRATEQRNIKIINALIKSGRCDIDKVDKSGATALVWAIELDFIDIAKFLLENNANTDINNGTPLMFRARSVDMIKLLASHGLNVNERHSKFLYTPLMAAAKNYSIDRVDILIQLGANPYMTNSQGLDSLMLAEKSGNINVLRYLQNIGLTNN